MESNVDYYEGGYAGEDYSNRPIYENEFIYAMRLMKNDPYMKKRYMSHAAFEKWKEKAFHIDDDEPLRKYISPF